MQKTIKRIVKRLFPELTGNLHLPQWGRVANVPTAINTPEKSTAFVPLYAVDIQLLDADGNDDNDMPLLTDVPLPASFAGAERGAFGFPQQGTLVELGFIHGLPSKPFIRSVLIENLVVPDLDTDDVLIKQSAAVCQRALGNGDWQRTSPEYIVDTAKNYLEQIVEIKTSLAGLNQHIEVEDGGTVWLGNESDNVLSLLSQLMAVVVSISDALASHIHDGVQTGSGSTGTANNSGTYSTASSDTSTLKGKLDVIVE